jgi:hypothetical protein
MAILYVLKTTIKVDDSLTIPPKFPKQVRFSEWNKYRKEFLTKVTLENTFVSDSNGNSKCQILNFALFTTLESANQFIEETKTPAGYQLLITEWNKLYDITHEHKFYNVDDNIKIGDDNILTTIETLSNSDIEFGLDTSYLVV